MSLETSGTSGARKRIFFTERDLEATVDFFHHGMDAVCAGTNRVGILMPGTNPDGLCDLLSRGIRRFGGVPLYYGPIRDADDCARWCLENRVETLVGIPSQVRRLALLHSELPVQNALLSSDYVSPALVETISRRWNARVLNHYGMTESGYGLAVQTEPGGPMCLRPDALLETLPDGELVLTTLDREAMPMLRYRTRRSRAARPGWDARRGLWQKKRPQRGLFPRCSGRSALRRRRRSRLSGGAFGQHTDCRNPRRGHFLARSAGTARLHGALRGGYAVLQRKTNAHPHKRAKLCA